MSEDYGGAYESVEECRELIKGVNNMATKKRGKTFPQGFSPCGVILYRAWLDKMRPAFDENAQPSYGVTIGLEPEDDKVKAWIKSIEALTKFTHFPWKTGEKSGKIEVSFKSYRPVKVVDSVGNPLPVDQYPWGGSIVRVAYCPNEYTGMGGGINLYLNGVQVIELVSGGSNVQFPVEEGAYVSEGVSKTPAEDGSAQGEPEDDDKGPF